VAPPSLCKVTQMYTYPKTEKRDSHRDPQCKCRDKEVTIATVNKILLI
jgi:hypothetical protein